jgi:hypothetical protein
LCSNVISRNAEGNAHGIKNDVTSTIEIADYTVTISISKKQSVLGKRRHEIISQASHASHVSHELKASQITKKEELGLYNHNTKYKRDTSSDASLYNSFGHNFLDM